MKSEPSKSFRLFGVRRRRLAIEILERRECLAFSSFSISGGNQRGQASITRMTAVMNPLNDPSR